MEYTKLSRQRQINLIRKAFEYKSASDSCSSVYMGSMQRFNAMRALGGIPGTHKLEEMFKKATEKQLLLALDYCDDVIQYMKKHPVKQCKCCGQICSGKARKKPKHETAASLRGIMSQVKKNINLADEYGDDTVMMPLKLAQRVYKALDEYERNERILTEPEVEGM